MRGEAAAARAAALAGVLPAATTVPVSWTTTAAGGAVVTDWLLSFADPQLQVLVDEALQNNLDLRAAPSASTSRPPW